MQLKKHKRKLIKKKSTHKPESKQSFTHKRKKFLGSAAFHYYHRFYMTGFQVLC